MVTARDKRRTYRPRRKRSGNPPPFQLTPRDKDILRAVARFRFLNSGHICRLIPGSDKNIRNRLKALFEHGFLDRPECQYDHYRPGGGSSLLVYGLGEEGARLLAHEDGFVKGRHVSWGEKNKSVGRPFLEHTLRVADFAVALTMAVRRHNTLVLVDGAALIARFPAETRARKKPLATTVPLVFKGTRHTIAIEPDYAFSLERPGKGRRANFLVEIDRGTMPIERSDLGVSSILRKLLAYQALWRTKGQASQWGWKNFRVLFVTEGRERMEHMLACQRFHMHGKGSPLFWFAERSTLLSGDLLALPWTDGENATRSLAPTC